MSVRLRVRRTPGQAKPSHSPTLALAILVLLVGAIFVLGVLVVLDMQSRRPVREVTGYVTRYYSAPTDEDGQHPSTLWVQIPGRSPIKLKVDRWMVFRPDEKVVLAELHGRFFPPSFRFVRRVEDSGPTDAARSAIDRATRSLIGDSMAE